MLFTHWFSISSWCLHVDINVYFMVRFFVERFVKLTKRYQTVDFCNDTKFNTKRFSTKIFEAKIQKVERVNLIQFHLSIETVSCLKRRVLNFTCFVLQLFNKCLHYITENQK